MDCASYMQIAVSKQRDRNANLWGLLLYYMLNVRLMFQASCETLETVVQWVVTEATRHSQVHFAAPSLLEQFVLVRPVLETGWEAVLMVHLLHTGKSVDDLLTGEEYFASW